MKQIKLTQGKYTLVDDEDYDYLNQFKWYFHREKYGSVKGYAAREVNNKEIRIHKILLNPPKGMETDHINGDGLDNRKSNLRAATKSSNQWNAGLRSDSISKFKGVGSYGFGKDCWRARIQIFGKRKHLGIFNTKEEAALAYDIAAKKYFGEYARYNFGY